MTSEKKVKLEAKKADQAAATSTAHPLANRFQRLSAAVTRHAFSFLTANELARGAFQVCKAFRSAYSIVEVTRRDTPEATVIELIQRAKDNLQQLLLEDVQSITAATLTALLTNVSPARFRSLSIKGCSNITNRRSVSSDVLHFISAWSSARKAMVESGQQVVPLDVACGYEGYLDTRLGADDLALLQRDNITLDGFAEEEGGLLFHCACGHYATSCDYMAHCKNCLRCMCRSCLVECDCCLSDAPSTTATAAARRASFARSLTAETSSFGAFRAGSASALCLTCGKVEAQSTSWQPKLSASCGI